ncbi:hypothetical protein [Mycobacterium sp. OTB74]|jgi:hypothetical protein|uniref:hypothetical protein n=1 Tax=Mycobacterium sp. OTB74 TaxID=1853452 RepID=UPI0024745105|nr:hypothetical protein [Mycobacterium sp. OTB74]MDH6243828.1 hypothetical protein [Mycobacterium sp. OTB74]
MSGWSWFTAYSVRLADGCHSTMPMHCPACGLEWNTNGIALPIHTNVRRGWGSPPPVNAVAAVFYECLGCGHCSL